MRRIASSAFRIAHRDSTFSCGFATTSFLLGKVVPFKLADIGEGILKVEVKEWHVKVGDTVKPFDSLCEVESDKAVTTIPSPYNGIIRKLYTQTGSEAFVGKPLVDIEVEGDVPASAGGAKTEAPASTPAAASKAQPTAAPSSPAGQSGSVSSTGKALATPAVRRIAKENNVDLSKVVPSGKDGRVLKGDVIAFLEGGQTASTTAASTQTQSSSAPALDLATKADTVIPLTGVRKAMVKSMTQANSIPAFGASEEIEISELIKTRDSLRKLVEQRKKGVKITFMPFFLKAASLSLLQFPELNAHTDEACTQLLVKGSHNLGFAMDTPKGLIVPNIKDVQRKSLFDIAEELGALMEKGVKGSLGIQDLQGATFTLSNIGSIGATYTKPVINPPQVAIGALGRSQKLPRFDAEGNVVAANIITVSWSADHRVVDGATMVRFSNLFKYYLENPSGMLLDLR
jgi:2-oxoisovalerate dehydrogenase E2 component (dihydrolipoyl transacylase)